MKRKSHLILGLLQAFVALGAIPAGYLLLAKPGGQGLGMSVAILANSPFKDFFIPGIVLFTVNGLCNLFSAFLSFLKFIYAPALGIMLGSALIIWIIVQSYYIGISHFLQPTFIAIGIIEIFLSIKLSGQNKKNNTHYTSR